ncbi:MAG: response regulator [Butyrivibrio sp.]|nr:response regulator [Butyrivibrio sp.]
MKLKVLITGKNKKVCRDIAEHLENDRGYLTVKCEPTRAALFDVILAELPKVIIIALGDETIETIGAFDVLKDVSRQGNCTIIVIAQEDDENLFKKYTVLKKVLFLSRPISLFALYEKMLEIEENIENNKDKNPEVFREFINEHADDKFRRKHILVVDDDSDQLFNIREQLEEFYDVTLVKSGEAAFKYLDRHSPDLILLDYLMPQMDGPEVLRRLKSCYPDFQTPVVFLTGMSEKSAVLRTLTELRPQGYIIKPAKKSKLVSKIIDVLG